MRPWTKREIENLVEWTLDGVGPHELGRRLHRCGSKVRAMQIELGLIDPAQIPRRWTEAEKQVVRDKYENTPSIDIARELGRGVGMVHQQANKLGLKKSAETIAAMSRAKLERGEHPSKLYRYPKGHVPANKGKRSPGVAPGRMAETQFRKGERQGKAAANFMPVGSTRVIEGYLYRKVSEIPNVPYTVNWKPEHYLIWEKAGGSIPARHALVFKDGNRGNVTWDNLELITRAELARRNTIHKLPEDLKQVIRLNASIKRRIRRIEREKQDDGPAQPSLRDARSA